MVNNAVNGKAILQQQYV